MHTHELLFELSHPIRYGIMKILAKEPTRLTKIGEHMEANNPEVSRHLDRLRSVGLIMKRPDNHYCISPFGSLALNYLTGLDFIAEHLMYFQDHDLSDLPQSFIFRLGELGECVRHEGALTNIHTMAELIRGTEKHIRVIFNEMSLELDPIFHDRMEQGVDWQLVIDRTLDFSTSHGIPDKVESHERIRVVEMIPGMMLCSEKMASIMFPDITGKIDYSVAYTSSDPSFLEWCEDLFNHLWEQGKNLLHHFNK